MRHRPRLAVIVGVALLLAGLGWTADRTLAASASPTSSATTTAPTTPVVSPAAAVPTVSPSPTPTTPTTPATPTSSSATRSTTAPPSSQAPKYAIAKSLAIKASTPPAPVARVHTGWAALDAAIARIPHYYPGIAQWHVGDRGAWGATQLDTGDIWIAPRTPLADLYSVVVHEYGHAISGHLYGGFYPAQDAADRLFGQQGEYGLEVEADCMARVEGATFTNYTPCANNTWRAYARVLVTMHKP